MLDCRSRRKPHSGSKNEVEKASLKRTVNGHSMVFLKIKGFLTDEAGIDVCCAIARVIGQNDGVTSAFGQFRILEGEAEVFVTKGEVVLRLWYLAAILIQQLGLDL